MYKKKVLALVLAALLIVSLVPTLSLAADFVVPAELEGANDLGVWPLAEGTYDPVVGAATPPSGAHILALFTMDAMYAITGTVEVPEAITGYTKVDVAADLLAGQWALVVNDTIAGSVYNYVVILPIESTPDTQPIDAPGAAEEPAVPDEPIAVEPPIATLPAEEATAHPSLHVFTFNGEVKPVSAYTIGGENYIKLRDVAALINTFDVVYADKVITLIPNLAYTIDPSNPLSTEVPAEDAAAKLSTDKVVIDGEEVAITAYKIAGSNYYRARSLADAGLGFTVDSHVEDGKTIVTFVEDTDAVTLPGEVPATEEPAATATVASIVEGLTVSQAGVGENTKAYSFASLADAQPTIDALIALGYTEDASQQGQTTTQVENTYSTFDLSLLGSTGITLYVYAAA
jgi:hypothetical protein